MIFTKLFQKRLTVTGAIVAILNLTSISPEVQAKTLTPEKRIAQANLPTLRLGMQGTAVRDLQTLLKQRGFYRSRITGNFDARTQAAVKIAQAIYKREKTGVVNAATWQVLRNPPRILSRSPKGFPPVTGAGAGRGDCSVINEDKPLTALVPESEKKIELTVSGRPTLFFYIPQLNTYLKEADFSLQDEDDNFVYRTRISLPKTPSVIGLTVPADASIPELQVNKNYKWTFSIICPEKREDEPYVTGTVIRKNRPDLVAKVKQTAAKDIPSVYAEAGIWYDWLASLAELRRVSPHDEFLLGDWANNLSLVGLNNLAMEPLVEVKKLTSKTSPVSPVP